MKFQPKASFRVLMEEHKKDEEVLMGRWEHICSLKEESEEGNLPEIDITGITGQEFVVSCKDIDE